MRIIKVQEFWKKMSRCVKETKEFGPLMVANSTNYKNSFVVMNNEQVIEYLSDPNKRDILINEVETAMHDVKDQVSIKFTKMRSLRKS